MAEVDAAADGQRLEVFSERCIGAGNCTDLAPAYFDQDPNDGSVILVRERFGAKDSGLIDEVLGACPVSAIAVRDETQ